MIYVTTQATVESEQGSLDYPRIAYHNLARDADLLASSEADNYPADSVQSPDTFEYWRPTALPATLRFDLGASQAVSPPPNTVNYLAIAAHNLGSKGCSVKVQYSTNGSNFTDASDVATPSDDSAILLLFPGRQERYIRLYVDGVVSPTEIPTIGVVYLGNVLVMPRMLYGGHAPMTLNRDTVLYRAMSEGGQFLAQGIRRKGFSGSASFRYLSASWYRTYFDPFVESARQYPYFFAWRPSDYPSEMVYAWTDEDIRPSNMGIRDFMQVGWKMKGFGNE